jgi:hypothetical protein
MMTKKQQAEHCRQEIIRALMLDGMTREEAEGEESRRFQRALAKLLRQAAIS